MLTNIMDEHSRSRIQSIRSRVKAMLSERQALQNSTAAPSRYWSDFCSAFDYMLDLPDYAFSKLRFHTYHFTGETYQTYYFGDAAQFLSTKHVEELIRDIPSKLIINEPPGGIGFHYPPNRFISDDILRFQKTINSLYRQNVLKALQEKERCYVLEIGAGYGGLAHHFSEIIEGVKYFIVDLPEALLFSAAYITLLNTGKRVYLYSPDDPKTNPLADVVKEFDFVLIPNYKLDLIKPFRFDLVLNVASLQEMKVDQVETYLNFIRETCAGVFYSRNQARQPRNQEHLNVTAMIRSRFQVIEIPEWRPKRTPMQIITGQVRTAVRTCARLLGLLYPAIHDPTRDEPYREFICTPLPLGKSGTG